MNRTELAIKLSGGFYMSRTDSRYNAILLILNELTDEQLKKATEIAERVIK